MCLLRSPSETEAVQVRSVNLAATDSSICTISESLQVRYNEEIMFTKYNEGIMCPKYNGGIMLSRNLPVDPGKA